MIKRETIASTGRNYSHYSVYSFCALLVALLMVACSSEVVVPVAQEPEVEEPEQELPMTVSLSAKSFAKTRAITRSWDPPASYYLYEELYESGTVFNSLSNKTIDAFFTKDEADNGLLNPLHGKLRYVPSKRIWSLGLNNKVDLTKIITDNYYVYGVIPRDAADSYEIARPNPLDNTSYKDGAVLTIRGMKPASYDACVIIGAKEGFSPDYDGSFIDADNDKEYDEGETRTNRLTAGDFKFHLDCGSTTTGVAPDIVTTPNPNYLYLLFDHLCSAVCFNIRVHPDYHKLRTIKLKELRLRTANDVGFTKKMDVTVTLAANNTGSNPIVGDVIYTPTEEDDPGGIAYQDAEGTALNTDYKPFMGHFMPAGVTEIYLTSTYDVYDKNTDKNLEGNLVRKDCTATNRIILKKAIENFIATERGKRYDITMTIKPTYLYVMSDPDAELEMVLE